MARWAWPAAGGVVTVVTGVVVNLATDWKWNPWAWVAVVLLTALGVLIAVRTAPTAAPTAAAEATPAPPSGSVHNSVSGTVHGPVIQAGSIGSYTDRSVNQTAVARDGGTVYQAGRDIRQDGS
ncbi:hypothetical protein [Umezawaea tangerina]|uniref:Uncharacterized protein n=1 Tax=Umezawaea tangerina TaxID=84725 RepID=A0A2T0TA84_9PSEU|nr:hypothetical protein [Umezawaea tangerina]PRY42549.1 hypothetical protein CLV43_104384 [Umezawaea tangerina]